MKKASSILGADYVVIRDGSVFNVDKDIDQSTARQIRWLSARTGASAATILEKALDRFLTKLEIKEKVVPFLETKKRS
jgi:hypothetical protein